MALSRARRGFAVVLDQGLWSATNFTILVALAHTLTPAEFGLVGVLYGGVVIAAGTSVAVASESLAVARGRKLMEAPTEDVSGLTDRAWTRVGAIACVVLLLSAVTAVALLLLGVRSGIGLVVVSAAPLLVVAETLRAMLYAIRDHAAARRVTRSWLVVQFIGFLFAYGLDAPAAVYLGAWLLGASASVVVARVQLPNAPSPYRPKLALDRLTMSFVMEYWATAAPTQLLAVIAGSTVGLREAGQVRALQTVFGPFNVVIAAIRNALVPAASQELRGAALRRAGVLVSIGTTLGTALLGLVVLVPGMGQLFMGNSWPSEVSAVVAFVLTRAAFAVTVGATVIHRAEGANRSSLAFRTGHGVATVGSFWLGCATGSVTLGLWLAAGVGVGAALAWLTFAATITLTAATGPQQY